MHGKWSSWEEVGMVVEKREEGTARR
jgi:hypothetical protein